MKTLLSVLFITAAALAEAPKAPPASLMQRAPISPVIRTDALVKVNASFQQYNPYLPWQKQSPGGRRGLGVVMPGNHILVTATMAADATYIELELPETEAKIPAKVVGIDYEANLALLAGAADDKRLTAFFSGLKPMEIETAVTKGDNLNIWQSDRVGDLLVTPLRVSKLMTAAYVVEGSNFLVLEGQGILRSEGNSFTLPVVKGGKLAGLLLRYDTKNQLTTVLPGMIIAHFLKDVADGNVEGFPSLGAQLQPTTDEQFREYLGLKPDQGGMYVSAVVKGNSADLVGMKKGDIVLSINGFAVDSRGDYMDPDYGRMSLSHVVRGRAYVGDTLEVKVLREGKETDLKGKLIRKQPKESLVWPYLFDRGPNYLVHGGLVFQELSRPFLNAFTDNPNADILRLTYLADHPEELEEQGRKKLIYLSMVLPTPGAQGYTNLGGLVVNKINGKPILQLSDAVEAFKSPKDGVHLVEFNDFPRFLHLDAAQADKDNAAMRGGAFRIGELSRLE